MEIKVLENVLKLNDSVAQQNREVLTNHHILTLNWLGSPGCGKTTLLEKTISKLNNHVRFGVIEGDLATTIDASRIAALDVPIIQINTLGTSSVCHLDASMIKDCLPQLPLKDVDVLVIENVGNLVCPSSYDLGENMKVVVLSITEGEEKPLKYPSIFHKAQAIVIHKIDLMEALEFPIEKLRDNIKHICPNTPVFEVSSRTDKGMDHWINFIKSHIRKQK